MLIAGGFQIAVRGNRIDVDASLGKAQFCALDFLGNIPAIQIINQRTERPVQAVYIPFAVAVKIVIDRDKAHSLKREHAGDIVSYRDVVPAEAGNILHQNTLDFPAQRRFQQRLHPRAVKVLPTVTIVRKLHHLCAV